MRKLLVLLIGGIISLQANAQYDADALAVLDAMSAKYKKINAYQADFSQKMINKEIDIEETFNGTIAVKGEKYVLKVAGQQIYNDGTDIWSYNPEIQEVTVSPYEPEEQEISMGNIYDLYKDGFKYNLVSKNTQGDRFIELNPLDRNKSYHKIKMTINSKDELMDFGVYEKSGNIYTYTIRNFKARPDLSDAYFTFNPSKYPSVEVIDFR
ncbi:outer membrane lipoprotein carrier protein LolA [Marinoscillum sp. MHG1-6]|uniref:LolA family protein n=1 Tax=Marinoscillum sp. MHG1-6 TaxID=2959627 RepID=UPI002158560B|nr:outer membrane lipoprotein carrier protein LolA [Marinoscillum sp. MHG1-6]